MKIIYITNARIPTEKAYGLQTASMCSAFARLGAAVTLVIPQRKRNPIAQDLFTYYGIEYNFEARYIPTIDAIGIGKRFGFWVTRLSYALSLLFSPFLQIRGDTVIFTRDLIAAVLLKLRGYRVFYDMHGFPYRFLWFWKKTCRMMDGIVCTNQWKVAQCKQVFGIPEERLKLARNGFTAAMGPEQTKAAARAALRLPAGKALVVYTGHLHDWKGVDVLAKAASYLPEAVFVFVGGSAEEIAQFKARNPDLPSNIIMQGQRPHGEIQAYLASADVLVLPNAKQVSDPRFSVYTAYDTSPLKLFEYMASHRPIVASSLPSIREILNELNAVLVEPDSPESLIGGIKRILADETLAVALQERAWHDVQQYTWANRAHGILDFMRNLIAKV